ncbi:MAG TPA: amidohydrolase family protein [Candidatus Angelobacter sp.]|nr:amidohydrolase family protein [Candidatus Angelobacter sp.]
MKRILAVTSFVVLAVSAIWVQSGSGRPTLAIINVNVIDATGSPVQPGMTVVIHDDRIVVIAKTATLKLKLPKNAKVVDGRNKFLIPGLWDMHVHTIFGDWIPGGKDVSLPLFVANGVTGIRDMGGDLDTLLQWRSQISAGAILGPRMIISGPMLDGPKSRFPSSVSITTAEEGRKAVDDLQAKGVDFIKVQSFITRDGYFGVAGETKKLGITLVGHVPDSIRASETIDAGQKSIEHLTGVFEGASTEEDSFIQGSSKGPKRYLDTYNDALAAALISRMARNHTWLVPTLVWERGQWLIDDIDYSHDADLKYAPASWQQKSWPSFTKGIMAELDTDEVSVRRRFVQKEFEIVNAMRKAGVPIMAGTDTAAAVAVLPGFSLHTELECFAQAGFTPMEALQTATLNPAKFLGLQSQMGTIEKGKLANLVLLDANPLEDIKNTRKIAAVVLNGRLLDRAELDQILSQVAMYASSY